MDPKDKTTQQSNRDQEKAQAQQAANLIRQKLDSLYDDEPDAKQEAKEADQAKHRSKHQQFIYHLTNSGKTLAEIQTKWHEYYTNLSDLEKQQVWDEFYQQNQHAKPVVQHQPVMQLPVATTDKAHVFDTGPETIDTTKPHKYQPAHRKRTVTQVKRQLLGAVDARHKLKAKQHFQSLVFGLGMGALVILILLFSFFNERFIAPFITPSRHVSSTPIIVDPGSVAVGPNPEVIIPKINVEIPVVYDEPSIADAAVQTALQRGVVHYATTPSPGEKGNLVIFGHSSNNIFNPGKYKFAFVLLSRLSNGDLFYLTKNGKLYAYKVYKKEIVEPNDVAVLTSSDRTASASLITCDPPGTSLHRLVVTGEQISPDPAADSTSTAIRTNVQPAVLPSNAPSLWSRFKGWLSH